MTDGLLIDPTVLYVTRTTATSDNGGGIVFVAPPWSSGDRRERILFRDVTSWNGSELGQNAV